MSAVKAVILFPQPTDPEAFDKAYTEEHIPLVAEKLPGVTKFTITAVTAAPVGNPPYYKIVELHYPSLAALQADFGGEGGRATAKHAGTISTGGRPTVLICKAEEVIG